MTPLHLRARIRSALARLIAMTRPMEEPPAAPVAAKPPMVWTDPSGIQWPVHPDAPQPWWPDEGQNERWKRDMRLALWRFANGHVGQCKIDLAEAGLSQPMTLPDGRRIFAKREEWQAPLFPVSPDLAAVSRRLGFARLAAAAWPGAGVFRGEDGSSTNLGWLACDFHAANEAAAQTEAERRFAVNSARAANVYGTPTFNPEAPGWDPRQGPFVFDSVETTLGMLSLGDYDGPSLPEGKVLAPLEPLNLEL